MKKISLLLVVFLFAFATVAIAEDGDWVKVEPKVVGQEQLSSASGGSGGGGSIGGKKITVPNVWFSYWGSAGTYAVRFYGSDIESSYLARAYVDGVYKGYVAPQRTFAAKNRDSSSALINLKEMTGQISIYEPGIHHIEIRVYISSKSYYSYGLYNLDVPYFEAGIYGISVDQNTVYVKYYLQPIFITITSGESVNVTIGDFYQGQAAVQTDQWGYYFVEIGIPISDYQNKMQNQQVLTSIEVQGHVREWQAYYW